jgi:hypothetical protein
MVWIILSALGLWDKGPGKPRAFSPGLVNKADLIFSTKE